MNKNLAIGLSITSVFLIILAIVGYSYNNSNEYINSQIKTLNDEYTFDDDGYQTIKTTYTYKDNRIKVDFETSPLPGDNPLGLYQKKEVMSLRLLDKDKFELSNIKVKGEDLSYCGNGGSVCATITKDIPADDARQIKSADISCHTEIFDSMNNKLNEAFEEASHMLY